MNVLISSDVDKIESLKLELKKAPSMQGLDLSSFVSTSKPYNIGEDNSKYRVAVFDFGIKKT